MIPHHFLNTRLLLAFALLIEDKRYIHNLTCKIESGGG